MAKYKVATNIFEIEHLTPSASWAKLSWHYDPFECEEGEPTLKITLRCGDIDTSVTSSMTPIQTDVLEDEKNLHLEVYKNGQGDFLMLLANPGKTEPISSVYMDHDMSHAEITLCETLPNVTPWQRIVILTSSIQLAYMLSNNSRSTILTHSSCILYQGLTYLFLGKSGTGKSTHSRMWLENIPDATLLNDDHPIIKISPDGEVIAYGSPWSGKTDCYRNLQAPIGGIVRIKRAPYNAIHRLSIVASYASLITSFSGMTIDAQQADDRHLTIERIVASVPCYELECLPDAEAAKVCLQGVLNKQ